MPHEQTQEHQVWPAALRWFHWINAFCISVLFALGLIMLNKSGLGITSTEAKINLKVVHVVIGYVFVVNLFIRVLLGFFGPPRMRWPSVFPSAGYNAERKRFAAAERAGREHAWLGHNPKAKLALSLMYLLLFTMAITGLVRAGTDIYYPPLGSYFAGQVAADGVDPATLIPYDKSTVNADKYKAMGEFKQLWGTVHIYSSYTLVALIFLHIFSVVRAELRRPGSLVSSIISGKKIFSGPPQE